MWFWRCKFIRWGKETWKRGDEWRGGGGEYEGVDEGEMEGLHSLLHTVSITSQSFFPFRPRVQYFSEPRPFKEYKEKYFVSL